tara:strand:+ start:5703 stop:5909 length:207 start_codon:yes stop_codon:yes gene_type:complete
MADSESDNGLAQRRSEVSDLAAIERRLAAIEKVVWALATHAGIAVDPLPVLRKRDAAVQDRQIPAQLW